MDSPDVAEERPSKRIRLEEPGELTPAIQHSVEFSNAQSEEDIQLQKELTAGITCYVSPHTPGFTGILKQRQVFRNSYLPIESYARPHPDTQTF
jgi:hypothetical protein